MKKNPIMRIRYFDSIDLGPISSIVMHATSMMQIELTKMRHQNLSLRNNQWFIIKRKKSISQHLFRITDEDIIYFGFGQVE